MSSLGSKTQGRHASKRLPSLEGPHQTKGKTLSVGGGQRKRGLAVRTHLNGAVMVLEIAGKVDSVAAVLVEEREATQVGRLAANEGFEFLLEGLLFFGARMQLESQSEFIGSAQVLYNDNLPLPRWYEDRVKNPEIRSGEFAPATRVASNFHHHGDIRPVLKLIVNVGGIIQDIIKQQVLTVIEHNSIEGHLDRARVPATRRDRRRLLQPRPHDGAGEQQSKTRRRNHSVRKKLPGPESHHA
jgi:hypothetical protein